MDKIAWHEQCVLRDVLRQRTLTPAGFSAALYAVRMGGVLRQVSGCSGQPVICVRVVQGGGKTHASPKSHAAKKVFDDAF